MKTLKLQEEFSKVKIQCQKCGTWTTIDNIDDVMNMANGTAFKCTYCSATLAEVVDA